MKKRCVCVMMVIILLALSSTVFPVSAQSPVSSEATVQAANQFTLSHTKKIMGVGTTATLTTTPYVTAIWSSSNPSVVSVHPTTGVMTAHKVGSATISAYYLYGTGDTCTRSCQIQVLKEADVLDEEYYIRYKHQDRYVYPVVNDPSLGPYLRIATKTNSDLQRWLITKCGDAYLIKSVQHNKYLGISTSNISIPTLYNEISDTTKWRFYQYGDACIIVPYLDQYSDGRVLSPSSNQPDNHGYIGLVDYFDSSTEKNWFFVCTSTYLRHYYDYSIADDPALINSIIVADQFIETYFDTVLYHDIHMVGLPTYYSDLWINQCSCGEENECNNSTDCYSHHKNYSRFRNEILLIQKSREQKLIMWSNHPSYGYFCEKDSNGIHTLKPAIALGDAETGGSRVRIYNFAVDSNWDPDVSASFILAHEIGHIFGIPEMYKIDQDGHSDDGDMVCVMQRYGCDRAEEFYDLIRKDMYGNITDENIVNAFCDECWEMLVENVDIS